MARRRKGRIRSTKVSAKGWIVIPAELRRKYDLEPGTRVQVIDYGDGLGIVPVPADPIAHARGLLKGGKSLTAALLEDRAWERAHER